MIYVKLFLEFLWVGAFTFGGGYGSIPLIRDVVLRNNWPTDETFSYMIAVSESTPGPVMVNLATYVGSSQGGLLGAVLATTAAVLPAFAIILLLMAVLKNAMKNPAVKATLGGMQPCAVGIILATGIWMTVKNWFPAGTVDLRAVVIALVLGGIILWGKKLFKKKVSALQLILISAVLGILLYGF